MQSSNNLPPPALPPKRSRINSTKSLQSSPPQTPKITTIELKTPVPDLLEHTANSITTKHEDKAENEYEKDLIEELDTSKYLVHKKPEEDGPDIRGGSIDALIIQATKATKNGGE